MIEFRNVSFAYAKHSGKKQDPLALENVSFSAKKGQIVGVAGPTGSGKSTLAQLACGLIEPTSGTVMIEGKSLQEKRSRHTLGKVGMVFQYPENQLFGSTVEDDVSFGPRNMKLPKGEIHERAIQALSLVGLDFESIGQENPFHLSGGQRRRVALAGVLAMQPALLILDEPTAGLDPQGKRDLLALIESMNSHGMTIMMVSHDMNDLAKLCQKIIVLDQGKVVLNGHPSEVFSHVSLLEAIGLEAPQISSFLSKLDRAGLSLPDRNSINNCEVLADAILRSLENRNDRYSKS